MSCCEKIADGLSFEEKAQVLQDYQRYVDAGKLDGLLKFLSEEHFSVDTRTFKLVSLVFAVSQALAWEYLAVYNASDEFN